MKKITLIIGSILLFGLIILAAACSSGTQPTAENSVPGKAVKSAPIGDNMTVTISNDTGKLKSGDQEIYLAFTDAAGKPVDAGKVSAAGLNFMMPAMGSMAPMNNAATFTTTATPGVYKGKVKIEMPGEWQAQISYEGKNGNGKTVIPVTAY